MRKILLTLMVLFAILGSALTGVSSFVSMTKFMKGVNYDKIAQIETKIAKAKTEGIDLLKDPSKGQMYKKALSFPSKTMAMVIKGLSALSIVMTIVMCIATFKKQSMAITVSIALAVTALVLFVITPDLRGGMTSGAALRTLMSISMGLLIASAASSFGAMKKIAQ